MTIHDQWTALYTAGRVRWMPGMLTADGWRVCGASSDRDLDALDLAGSIPDFTDPATVGCLLHQAREAWDSPRLQTSPMLQPAPPEWICYPNACEDDGRRYLGDSEPAAILAAIAAAPPKVNP
jgi:hypothetical protein